VQTRTKTRMALLAEGLSERNIQFIEDMIEIFTQESKKLDGNLSFGSLAKLTGVLQPTAALHIHGHPTSGKTALVCYIINKIPDDRKVLWIDTTFSFSNNLIKNKESVFVFQTAKLEPAIDIVGNYAAVVIDDFASVVDAANITHIIGECKRNNTFLAATAQERYDLRRHSPRAMRANLTALFDVSLKMQKAETRTDRIFYQTVVERHRIHPTNRSKYCLIPITKQGVVIEGQRGNASLSGRVDGQGPAKENTPSPDDS